MELAKANERTFTAGGSEITLNFDIVRRHLIQGSRAFVTDEEIAKFMGLCKFQGLNPFLNEIYFLKVNDYPATFIVSKEAFLKRAEANAAFDGLESGLMVERDGKVKKTEGAFYLPNDQIRGAWASVYRKDRRMPFTVSIAFDEYKKTKWNKEKKIYELTSFWAEKPGTMIRKVAVVQALREAFPSNLNSMYIAEEVKECNVTEEELQQNAVTIDEVEEIERETVEQTKLEEKTETGAVSVSEIKAAEPSPEEPIKLEIEPGTESEALKSFAKEAEKKSAQASSTHLNFGVPTF